MMKAMIDSNNSLGEADAETMPTQRQPQQENDRDSPVRGRPRAVSVASTHPSVETVVAKSKRAASTLWMLLHSQNCILGNRCTHTGCREAKKLHLHLKTCPCNRLAGGGGPCPTSYNGCEQARQLLNHYRRCKSQRARLLQVGQRHHCLICSLVARQARNMLDRTSKSLRPARGNNATTTSKVVAKGGSSSDSSIRLVGDAAMLHNVSPVSMPPPPPRRGILLVPNKKKVADASATLAQNKSISFATSTRTRPRSSSVGMMESPTATNVVVVVNNNNNSPGGRSRSRSVGASPESCETIPEEPSEFLSPTPNLDFDDYC